MMKVKVLLQGLNNIKLNGLIIELINYFSYKECLSDKVDLQ